MRVRKLKNGEATGGDEITREIIKGRGDWVVDEIWRLCNMAVEIGVLFEDLKTGYLLLLFN